MRIDDNTHRSLGHAKAALKRSKECVLTHYLDACGIRRGIVRYGDHTVWSESHVLTASEIWSAIMGKSF